ncbi:putative NAD-specific glutamate dehydrogenase [Agrobacterium tumefaciens CCNWGS0286]|nr:putative NAD-specific glutamate dehydrogenase [Agrobacterium tumefaciens CCNWGS0286]
MDFRLHSAAGCLAYVVRRREVTRLCGLLVVLDFFIVGVDDVVLAAFRSITGLGLLRFVNGLTKLHGNFHEGLGLRLNVVCVRLSGFDSGLQGGYGVFDCLAVGLGNLVTIFLHRLFGGVNEAFGLVFGFHTGATLLVGFGIGFGVLDHLFDVGVGKTAGGLDADLLFLAGALVFRRNLHDAVGVDIEGDFDLRNAARRRWQADEVELAEQLVVLGHFTLALRNADGHGRLVVFGGREGLALLRRDRRVAIDQTGEDATQRFDAERQRRHVEQQNVLDVALQNAGLDGGAHGNHFIRVHALVRLLAEQLLNDFLHLRHAAHATDENDFIDLGSGNAGILERCLARRNGALHEVIDQAFELGAGQLQRQVLRAGSISRDERQVDFGLLRGRQFDLRLFGSFLEALQGKLVVLQVDALILLELAGQIFDETHVEVFTAKEGITIGGLHFENAVADFQNGNIEGAAAKVVNGDGLAVLLVEAVSKRCRGRLVDDAQNIQTGNAAGILGCLTLGVVKIGRNGDDGLFDLFTEIGFSRFLHLLKDHRGNLRRGIIFVLSLHPCVAIVALDDFKGDKSLVLFDGRVFVTAADKAFHRKQGIGRVGDRLALGRLADKAFAIVGKCHHGRRGARAFRIFNYFRVLAVHHCDAGIGRAKVDTDYFCHALLSLKRAVGTP